MAALQQRCGVSGRHSRSSQPQLAGPRPVRLIVVPAHHAHQQPAVTVSPFQPALHLQRGRRSSARLVVCAAEGDDGRTPDHPYPWEEDFDLLSDKVKLVTDQLSVDLRGCNIWLTGMMGSGKSTVGKMLANTLKYAFFDTDAVIEKAHEGKPVSEIFKDYGQDYFRKCESQIIRELSPYRNLIISTGGGAVLKSENWGYMQMGIVCWLNGDVELLAARVAQDGIEKRPLLYEGADSSEPAIEVAKRKLSAIAAERRKYYQNADVVVGLEGYGKDAAAGAPTAAVMYRLMEAVNEKVQAKKRERADRMNFKVENGEELRTMRTIQSPILRGEEEQQQ